MTIELQTLHLVLLASALVSFYVMRSVRQHRIHNKLPPGPRGIPFFGNIFQLSMTPWKEFESWKEEFGPLVYVTAAGQGILAFNTHEAATGFLDRRGHVSEDRPRLIVASEMLCGGLMMALIKSNDTFRRMRRVSHEALSKSQVTEYHPIQVREAVILTDEIMRNPKAWEGQFRRASASNILSIIYDLPKVLSIDDRLVQEINEFSKAVARAAMPGAYFVEFFTWMKHLPSWIAPWKKEVELGFLKYSGLFGGLFQGVKSRISEGDDRSSFVGTLVRAQDRHRLSDLEGSWLAANLYAGGAETTATSMTWFMLAMIAHPEKQKKCQEELDAIIGRARMPTFKDRDNLPYLQATIRELLRWRAVFPAGVPHYTKEDEWYEGYFIPKGTICISNTWCMNRDRAIYGADADDFNPDRFIDEEGRLADTRFGEEGHAAYGFGPRICVGRHMANDTLFIQIACLLWATNISPVMDEAGKPIIPDTLESVGAALVVCPRPFDCVITPRFPDAPEIVAQTRELL